MAAEDLSTPLGQNAKKPGRVRLPVAVPQAIAAALALFVVVFVA